MSNSNDQWLPEIMYEENSDGTSSSIPFVMVPQGESMPSLLYIFESTETGESELGSDGEALPIIQWDLHQYADMAVLKSNLPLDIFDQVRECLGLQPLGEAATAGQRITSAVRGNLES